MLVEDLVSAALGDEGADPSDALARSRRQRYAVLVDLRDGDHPRQVESVEWDDDARVLLVSVG